MEAEGKVGKTPQRGAVFPMWWRRTSCHRKRIQDARWASQRGRDIRKEIFMSEVWRLWAWSQRLSLYVTQSPCAASWTKWIQAFTIGASCDMCGWDSKVASNELRKRNSVIGVKTWRANGSDEVWSVFGCWCEDKRQLVDGKIGESCVEVLRDTDCTEVLIKQNFVNQGKLTGEKGYVTTFDKTLLIRAPIAKIEVDTPYFAGEVEGIVCPGTSCWLDYWQHYRSQGGKQSVSGIETCCCSDHSSASSTRR